MKKVLASVLSLLLVLSSCFLFASCDLEKTEAALPTGHFNEVVFEDISSRADLFYAFPEPSDVTINGSNSVSVADYGAKGDGKTDDSAAIAAAAEAARGKALYFAAGVYKTGADLTIPENVNLVFAAGAVLSVSKGATLTVNSKKITAPYSTVFAGEGAIAYMPNIEAVKIEWFGGKADYTSKNSDASTDCRDALQKAVDACKTVVFGYGRYYVNGTVKLPSHAVTVIGGGPYNTYLHLAGDGCLFEGGGKDFHLGFMHIQEKSDATPYGVLNFKGKGKLLVEGMVVWHLQVDFTLENTKGAEFRRMNVQNSGLAFTLKNCTDTTFLGLLCHDQVAFLRADGGSDMKIIDSSGVWDHAVDFEVKNFKNFSMISSSSDLGYNSPKGDLNKYAIYLENVDGFEIKGCWVATNGGVSGMCVDTNPSVPHILADSERAGVYVTNSQNGEISGCSINNSSCGIKIVNSPKDAGPIVIDGNSFGGNAAEKTMAGTAMPGDRSSIYIENVVNVTVQMNFLNRFNSGFSDPELMVKGTNTNLLVCGNSFRYIRDENMLKSRAGDAVLDSNIVNIG